MPNTIIISRWKSLSVLEVTLLSIKYRVTDCLDMLPCIISVNSLININKYKCWSCDFCQVEKKIGSRNKVKIHAWWYNPRA
jgi:hypothetical protein